jgi:hypothetical protein
MEFPNVSRFPAQAAKCLARAQKTDDKRAKLRLLTLAEAWLRLSENMENQDFEETFGVTTEPLSMPQLDARP